MFRLEIEPRAFRPQVQRLTAWAITDLPKQSVGMCAFLEYINVKNNPLYDITRMQRTVAVTPDFRSQAPLHSLFLRKNAKK